MFDLARLRVHSDARPRAVWRRLLSQAGLAAASLVLPAASWADTHIVLTNASIVEGNAGTQVLKIPFNFDGPQPGRVTGTVMAIPLSGTGFTPATGGASCGTPGVDFEQFSNVPFNIPPNTPNGTLSINVRVCSNTTPQPNRQIFIGATVTSGTVGCTDGCGAIGTIVDDDGPPTLSISSITVTEPTIGTRTATFTVKVFPTSPQPIQVHFATRDGSAKARCIAAPGSPFCQQIGDYVATSGTVPIAANADSATFGVTVLPDRVEEPNEFFLVDLSVPVGAQLGSQSTASATIRDGTLTLGGLQLSTDAPRALAGERFETTLDWAVPDHLVWRNLKTLDLRLTGDAREPLLWLRWEKDKAGHRISLCEADAAGQARCSAGARPGSATVLGTRHAQLHLADTQVLAGGATGQQLRLKLSLSLAPKLAPETVQVEVSAADEFGNVDRFVPVGELLPRGPARD